MNGLQSGFAVKILQMFEFREAIGYKAETHEAQLTKFDAFCYEHHPTKSELTEQIVLAWATSKTGNSTGANQAIRAFGYYLESMGESAYVLPESFSQSKRGGSDEIYMLTDAELSALFREIDSIKPTADCSHIDIVAPVLFRLIYTCGLRPSEGRELLSGNVCLDTGEILITKTKKLRERIVVMSDDMLEMCRIYSEQRRLFLESSPFFFPEKHGTAYSSYKIDRLLKSCWARAKPDIPREELPPIRVYSFRHQFASACLIRWLNQGLDLMVMLPYLRAFMGHLRMDDTAYYIKLLPENLVKSAGIDWDRLDSMLPEVTTC